MQKLSKKENIALFSCLGSIAVVGVVVMVFLLQPPSKVPVQEPSAYSLGSSVFTESSTPSAVSNTSHDTTVSTSTRVTAGTTANPFAQNSILEYTAPSEEMNDNDPTSKYSTYGRLPANFSIPVRTYETEVSQLEEDIAREIERLQQYYGVELPEEVRQKRTPIENELAACKKQWAAEADPIKAQLSALEQEKQQVLAQALADAGGQINAEYQAKEREYNARIAVLQGQISAVDGKYRGRAEALENQLSELPTEQEIENMFRRELVYLEDGYYAELARIKLFYYK